VLRAIGQCGWQRSLAAGCRRHTLLCLSSTYASSFSGSSCADDLSWVLMLRAIGTNSGLTSKIQSGRIFSTWSQRIDILLARVFRAASGQRNTRSSAGCDRLFFEPLWTNFKLGPRRAFWIGTRYLWPGGVSYPDAHGLTMSRLRPTKTRPPRPRFSPCCAPGGNFS